MKKPGAPFTRVVKACVSLTKACMTSLPNSSAPRNDEPSDGIQAGGAVTRSQKALRRSTRRAGGLPAMMAELMAPIEIPPIQFGCRPASARAW